jgi:hypothetical protein
MSLLTMVQNVCLEQGLPRPESVVNATDVQTRQLLAIANRAVREMRTRAIWPKLTKLASISLLAGQDTYALPADIDRQIHRTHWNRSKRWELIGPITPQEWEFQVNSPAASSPWQRYRMNGWGDKQFNISPTPTAADELQIIAFQYQSTNAIVPRSWGHNALFLAGEYCSWLGRIYYTELGGLTPPDFVDLPPVHTTGTASDGSVLWDVVDAPYLAFRNDQDMCVLDEDVLGLGIQWRFMQQKGLAYEKIEAEYEKALMREITAEIGARTLSIVNRSNSFLLSNFNIPDSGFGS